MSDGKTSRREKKIIRSRYKREQEDQKDDSDEKGTDSDWGFSEGEKGMSKETKIALSLITVLLVAFGYVVYQKMTKSEDLFSGSDEKAPMKVAKAPKKPSETESEIKSENNFGLGTDKGEEDSNVFGPGNSNENNKIVQDEPFVNDEDDFFSGESSSLGDNGTINGQQPDGFIQTNNEYPYSNRNANPLFDASTGNENFGASGASTGTQNQFPDFDQDNSLSRYNQPNTADGSGTEFGLGQNSQPGIDRYGEVEMAGDAFSNSFDAADDVRDTESQRFLQPAEPAQIQFSENQQFLNNSSGQQELNSNRESYGFEDRPAGDTVVQPEQYRENQLTQSPQYPAENNSQYGQADLNASGDFGADLAAENRYRPETGSSIDRDTRYGQYRDPNYAREDASAKITTVWREHPGEFGNRLDSTSRSSVSSSRTQPGVYEILSGDNYWSISKKQYGTARYFLALSRYNRQRIPDEKRMRPGMKVLTPSPEILQIRYPDLFPKRSTQSSLTQKSASTTTKTSQPAGFFRGRSREPLYRVGEEDTLSGIAQRHLGLLLRWIQIYEMNRSRLPNQNNLTIGTVLQLPADASNVRLVRNPQRGR